MGKGNWVRIALLVVLAPGAVTPAVAAQEDPSVEVAQALLLAFNAHDPDAMAALVSADFELFYFDEDGRPELALTGPDALRTEMIRYFEARPAVRSEIAGSPIGGGRFVAFREQIAGGASSLAVYEIENSKVRRTWYYPAEG